MCFCVYVCGHTYTSMNMQFNDYQIKRQKLPSLKFKNIMNKLFTVTHGTNRAISKVERGLDASACVR